MPLKGAQRAAYGYLKKMSPEEFNAHRRTQRRKGRVARAKAKWPPERIESAKQVLSKNRTVGQAARELGTSLRGLTCGFRAVGLNARDFLAKASKPSAGPQKKRKPWTAERLESAKQVLSKSKT